MRAVESTDVIEEDGITVPDTVMGATMVVRTWMVVTGTAGAVVETPDGVTLAAQVTMAGLEPTCAAQIPWK